MEETKLLDLAKVAMVIAGQSANLYLEKWGKAAPPDLLDFVRIQVIDSIASALDDVRAAFDCGMIEAGEATFKASMALAGIRAAKKAIGEAGA